MILFNVAAALAANAAASAAQTVSSAATTMARASYKPRSRPMRTKVGLIADIDLRERVIAIDQDMTSLTLRHLHDSIFPSPKESDCVVFVLGPAVAVPLTGEWPDGVSIEVQRRQEENTPEG